MARAPIDPNLPPDHPLEPGSGGRSRPPAAAKENPRPAASAAERVAASEAALAPTKPPVIADPSGGKSNFIAAARRAAQAAASSAQLDQQPAAAATVQEKTDAPKAPKKQKQNVRKIVVAAAVVLLVVGCLRVASKFIEGGSSAPTQESPSEKLPPRAETLPDDLPAGRQEQTAPAATGIPLSAPPATKPAPPNAKRSSLQGDTDQPLNIATAPAGTGNDLAPWALPDVTGTLQRSAPNAKTAPPAASAITDKLPAAIGGPVLRTAALGGDAAAAYEIGIRFAEGRGVPQNNEEAARWLDRAAKQGLAPAQFRLGGLYEKGIGVKKDLAAARDLYQAAANKGNAKAMHNLAVLYAEGLNAPADYHAASHWFRMAADRGIADSQYNLGILYARGIGVEQNYAESYKWFLIAANQGDGEAAKKLAELVSHLDPQSLAVARSAAQAWTAEPLAEEANVVKAPAGGWDAAGAPKAKPRSAAKPSGPNAKIN
jgi:localization factor PodJL